MSIITNLNILSNEARENISKDLEITIENKFGMGPPKYIYPYTMCNETIKLPFAYAIQKLKLPRLERSNFPGTKIEFTGGVLREEQKIVRREALTRLSSKGSVIISGFPGFGKTATAIELAAGIGFKTLVIVNKIVLIKQWKESIEKFCPGARTQCITVKSKKEDSDFYIINAQNVEKMGREFFKDIGLCLVDEVHMIVAESLSKCLQHIFPRYMIGLSATPYRPDGLDILLELYFGDYKIIRKLYCKHTVYRVETGFTPPVEKTAQGRLNWGAILDAQATNQIRNDLIVKIIRDHSTRNFLVLVKRVSQGEYLSKTLQELGESVTDLIGSNQVFDTTARILIGTCQKVGVGFDHAKMDTLLLATDIEEYFIQYLGRVFRTKEVEPIIFDLVDKNGVLIKHFNTRKSIYKEHGGTVINYQISV